MADGCPTVMWVTDAQGDTDLSTERSTNSSGPPTEQVEGGKWQPADSSGGRAGLSSQQFMHAVEEHTSVPRRGPRPTRRWRVAVGVLPRGAAVAARWEFLGHVGLSPDITERKQAEEALRRSEEKFRQLAENIREVFWMTTSGGQRNALHQPGI